MEIKIKATGYEMTPETSQYLAERITALERLIDPGDETALCEVEVGKTTEHHRQGNIWVAEFQIVRGGERLRAVAEAESLNAAIDGAKDEMLRQLRHSKGKSESLARRAGKSFKDWLRFGNS